LDRLSSGMTSLRASVVKGWMTSDSDPALASTEKVDVITSRSSRRQEVLNNHVDDEKCSVICEREASLRVQEVDENHAGEDQMDSKNDKNESFLLDTDIYHGKDNHTGLERDGIHADFDSDKSIGNDIEHDIDGLEFNNNRRSIETTLSAIKEVNHWNARGLIHGDSDKSIGSNDDIDEQFLIEHDDVLADGGLEFNNNRRSIERTLSRSFTGG
jgi:hypothetical protein